MASLRNHGEEVSHLFQNGTLVLLVAVGALVPPVKVGAFVPPSTVGALVPPATYPVPGSQLPPATLSAIRDGVGLRVSRLCNPRSVGARLYL